MEVKNFIELVYKRLWIILLVTFIATLGSAYINLKKKTSSYEADSKLYILTQKYNSVYTQMSSGVSYDDIMVSKQLIMDYKELLKSKMVLDATSKELNIPGVDANYLEGKVSLNGINSSNLIMLSAIDSSPVKARNIANTLANVFINKVKELTNEDNVGIVDLAETPTIQIATSAKKNIAMAFMIALLGTISMIYIFDQLDDTVRKPEWVEGEFKLKVLGMIPMKDIK